MYKENSIHNMDITYCIKYKNIVGIGQIKYSQFFRCETGTTSIPCTYLPFFLHRYNL